MERIFGETQCSGFYVDVGAYHPMEYSNTYAFYKKGWRGINIDARPGSMQLFHRFRANDINLELAISDKAEVLTYYEHVEPARNGFFPSDDLDAAGAKIIGTTQIPVLPLAEVLDKYMPPSQSIDFLDIDVEGLDERVLRSNNWEKYRPRVVLTEQIGVESLNRLSNCAMVSLLDDFGYDLFAKTFNTLIFRQRS